MPIRRLIWSTHALERLPERGLIREEVERAIRDQHPMRERNEGHADRLLDAGRFVVVYDHPHDRDIDAVCVVTVWRKRPRPRHTLRLIEGESERYPER